MKRIKLFIHEPSINKIIGRELNLLLPDTANLIDAINEVDKMINSKGNFPALQYRSLLHMIYNPIENRFYKQVAITAHKEPGQMLNVRDNPKQELPEETMVTLIPAGGCISEWEEAVDYEELLRIISQ
ncbi:MAG: hypothetical protein ACE5L6_01220 [Candidatus Bathyarchaeia archaeon]